MRQKFLVKLSQVHERNGETVYRVAKNSGVNYNTVKKYAAGWIEADFLSPEVVRLADYYGVDWRDPNIVEVIDEESGDTKPVEPVDPNAVPLPDEMIA